MNAILKILCYWLLFFSLAQPAVIFPSLIPYRVFFLLAGTATVIYLVCKLVYNDLKEKLPQSKYIFAILITYTLSKAQYLWIPGTIDTFLIWFKKVILYFVIIYAIEKESEYRKLVWSIILAVVVLTFSGWDLFNNHPELLHDAGRFESVGNYNLSNSYAFLVTVTIPLAYSMLEVERGIIKKGILIFTLIFISITCVYTKSRAGCLGMMIAWTLSLYFSKRLFKNQMIKFIAIGVIGTVFIGFGVSIILSRSDAASMLGGDNSAMDRIMCWKAAIRMWMDNPIFGVGWGKYIELGRDYGLDKRLIAHNTPLNVLAETGIFGFIFFMTILYIMMKQLWQMRKFWSSYNNRVDMFIFSQAVIISLIGFIIDTTFSVKDHDPIYWALIYLTGVLCKIFQKEKIEYERI